jgi:hypothetical protein
MTFGYAIKCLECGCIHGWIDHPHVVKIEKHSRTSMEDVWYCPECNKQHRTTDGTMFGQLYKRYEEIPDIEIYLAREPFFERMYFSSEDYYFHRPSY